jgi:hypothetical protein
LKAQGYACRRFADGGTSAGRSAILRHDVDISMEKALAFAAFERGIGVRSTFFFLLTSPLYNLAAARNSSIVREIADMGHEVGLHFDESIYLGDSDCDADFTSHLNAEARLFEDLTGRKVRSFSMHQPSRRTIESDIRIAGFENAYSKEYMTEYHYVSDSMRRWKEDPIDVVHSMRHPRLQLLSHPFWYNDEEQTRHDSMLGYVLGGAAFRYDNFVSLVEDYRTEFPRPELDSMLKGAL